MLRKNYKRKITGDLRGKITSGNRGKGEKENPKSLEYFNVSEFPELVEIYGDEPTKIVIMFATDNIEEFYFEGYEQWKERKDGRFCFRRCDGAEAVDPLSGEVKDCYCAMLSEKERCRFVLRLKAFIVAPTTGLIVTPLCYRFESHSENSADSIRSEIEKTWALTGGRLRGIAFTLSVEMVQQLKADHKKRFPLWSLQAVGTVQNIMRGVQRGCLPTGDSTRLHLMDTIDMPEVAASLPQPEQESRAIEAPKPKKLTSYELAELVVQKLEAAEFAGLMGQEKKSKADKIELIKQMILEMSGGNGKSAKSMLWDYSVYKDAGYRTTTELSNASERRLNTIYGKVKDGFSEYMQNLNVTAA